jgi:hypothetical protein
MKPLRFSALILVFSLMLIPTFPFTTQAYEDTQCFQCHTSAKKLIQITREIAKTKPALKSSEIEGEG